MSAVNGYTGEIRMFAGTVPPSGWLFCQGQILEVSEHETLFSLIGPMYGGDGGSTFGLPDMRGRVPVHRGDFYPQASRGGVESVTLSVDQMPMHYHMMQASPEPATQGLTRGAILADVTATAGVSIYYEGVTSEAMDELSVLATGGNQPHTNLQPYNCVNYIICVDGIYPSMGG